MPVTSAAPAFPTGIPLSAGQQRTQRLHAVAANSAVALAHPASSTNTASSEAPAAPQGKPLPTFSSNMHGRCVRLTGLHVSSHLNGQHGTIADIRSCDGALLFDVELQAAVAFGAAQSSARPAT